LVRVEGAGAEKRFRLLETLREYAAEQLSPEERAQVAQWHAEYYRVWAEPAEPELRHGPQQNYWLDRLEVEHDNLRAALDWAEETGTVERGFQLAASLERFWRVRSHLAEGQQRLTRLLDLAGATMPEVARARTLNSIGWFTHRRGAYAAAVPLHEQALGISHRLEDRHEIAVSLRNLGAIAMKEGNSEVAYRYLEESLAISEALGDKRETAASMSNLGLTLLYSGHYSRARLLFEQALKLEQALALNQQSGPSFSIAALLNNLGFALLRQGDLDEARSLLVQSLRLKEELGNADGIPYGLEGLAELAAARGQWARAVRLFAVADAAREVGGHPRCPPSECAHCERLLALAREALGAEAFAIAWSEGGAWNAEQGVAYALQEAEPDSRTW
jgi:tetratricopeptide (TPR) repeat protein